ncbi:MAG TPA: polyribonucleotide nucleotidyltransferase [Caldisericia bacterium]|nr:polyribonucleotide nucleotidyltransferase [Caldisericia bacterium]HPF49137.1 polyribonucleotide nucleotidyltransferase [Caldisericia bacterium]HPI82999.1 polyribonucleotide nucleotidyltransferase [Caldisericia bacterium]HPQ92226.1 polyribonucleotide nucleotidyltransferase [Caldisericia bacterium]HRV74676.1 polyribonucleotide nucleotidyltransferase [Caldisericia bacterium]
MNITESTELGRLCHTAKATIDGVEIEIKAGKVALQAGGSVLVQMGGTVVLATAVVSKEPREGVDFFPLVVDYSENLYAAGKIPGGFFKRGGRPSEFEILRARMIDRPIRPLFPKHCRNEIQVVVSTLSSDGKNSPDILGIIGASAALTISNAPFEGPVAAVRIGILENEYIINPSVDQIEQLDLDIVLVGTKDAIMMVEAGAKEVSEEQLIKAFELAQSSWDDVLNAQVELGKVIGKEKIEVPPPQIDDEVMAIVDEVMSKSGDEFLFNPDKEQREGATHDFSEMVKNEVLQKLGEEKLELVGEAFEKSLKNFVRDRIVDKGVRPDGRATNEIRKITMEVGMLPNAHGSGLFLRGQTQVLSVAVLGSKGEGQLVEGLNEEEVKRYMHYYSFPPYSVGEVRPIRGPSRRDIGHGNLAERSLIPLIPSEDDFPYAIQVFSNVLESNGSSSMASVCGSSLALMDAGVPIKAPAAGIAMGLIAKDGNFKILTDIQGVEDAMGDMDFKVAGTRDGITGLQMDIKIKGITIDVIRQALSQAKEARLFILDQMEKCLDKPRPELSATAPRVFVVEIDTDKIRDIIGPGGKVIKKIIEDTGCKIDIEQDGRVFITAPDAAAGAFAKETIADIVEDAKEGKTYLGKVTSIRDFGAFVNLGKGNKEGLLHISEIAHHRVAKVEDELSIGDEIMVMVKKIDETGRISLTRKGLIDSVGSPPKSSNNHDKPRRNNESRDRKPRRPRPDGQKRDRSS